MLETDNETVLRVATEVARNMAPKVSHRHPFNEILSTAWIGAKQGQPSYKPEAGELGPYIAACARRHLSRWLWLNSSVVSAAINDRYALKDVFVDSAGGVDANGSSSNFGTSQDRIDVVGGTNTGTRMGTKTSQYQIDIDRIAYRQACAAIFKLVESSDMADIVCAVVIEDERPAAVAERTGVELSKIYRACASVRAKIKQDPKLRRIVDELWQK